jgi:hypothetical protein
MAIVDTNRLIESRFMRFALTFYLGGSLLANLTSLLEEASIANSECLEGMGFCSISSRRMENNPSIV